MASDFLYIENRKWGKGLIKKITLITLATIIAVGFMHGNSYAESGDDLKSIQDKREDIKEDLSGKEDKSNTLISEIKDLNKEVQHGNTAIEEKEELIEDTEQDITDTIKAIHSLQDEVKGLEASIEERYDILKERLASYQKSGGRISYLDVIFGADDFSEFTSSVSLVNKVTDSDVALMDQIEKDTEDVEKKQNLALDKLDELNDVKAEQENALAFIDEERQENKSRIDNLREKQQELSQSSDELQLEDSDLASLEKETKESIAVAHEAKAKAGQQAKLEAKSKAEQQAELEAKAKVEQQAEPKTREKAEAKEEAEKQSEKKTLAKKTENEKAQKKVTTETNENKVTETSKETKPEPEAEPEGEDKKSFTVTSTAYTANCNGCSGVTTTGIDLNKNPNRKVIAVDTDVIPLGSIVKVEGYGYAVAADTGGAINGKKIDV